MGVTGVWYSIAISNVLIVVGGLWFLRGTWTENVVDESPGKPSMADD